MKILRKIFKRKKKAVEIPSLANCLESLDVLRDHLVKSRHEERYDDMVTVDLEFLSDNIERWQREASLLLVRYKYEEIESSYGKVKLRK